MAIYQRYLSKYWHFAENENSKRRPIAVSIPLSLSRMRVKDGVLKYGFVGPALIFLIAFNIFPLFYNIYLSFTDAELSGGIARLVGGRNYGVIFDDTRYGTALRTTGLFVVLSVATELLLGFALALALQKPFWGKPAITTILLVPMMLSPAVMGLYWNFILNGHYGRRQSSTIRPWPLPTAMANRPQFETLLHPHDRHLDVDAIYDAHRPCRPQCHPQSPLRSRGH